MAYREFKDRDAVRWEVWNVFPTLRVRGAVFSEDAASGWLAFRSEHESRRLYQVPDRWDQLAEEELDLLLQRAVPVRHRS